MHATSTDDPGCSYEYGRAAANEALQSAATALSGGTVSPTTVTWWLDVEGSRTPGQPGNTWVGSGRSNTADLQGFIDALWAAGVPEVGLYSTSYQWNDITGGYTPEHVGLLPGGMAVRGGPLRHGLLHRRGAAVRAVQRQRVRR